MDIFILWRLMTPSKCMKDHDPLCRVSTTFVYKIQNLSFRSSKLMFCLYLFVLHTKSLWWYTHLILNKTNTISISHELFNPKLHAWFEFAKHLAQIESFLSYKKWVHDLDLLSIWTNRVSLILQVVSAKLKVYV